MDDERSTVDDDAGVDRIRPSVVRLTAYSTDVRAGSTVGGGGGL